MNAKKLALKRTTLRLLKADELGQAGGGSGWTTTDAPTRICPPPSMYTGCPACFGAIPSPTIVINPAKK